MKTPKAERLFSAFSIPVLSRHSWLCWAACRKSRSAFGVFIGVGLLFGQGDAQTNLAVGQPAAEVFDVWRVEDGWQQSAVTGVLQARNGYLWLGTYHGLVRFDGVRYTVYDSSNSPELENGLITSLYEDASAVLWIGHETGQLTRMIAGR